MDGDNLVLVVGAYADAGAAADDFKTLKAGEGAGDYQVVGAVVLNRDADGKVDVDEHGDAHVAGGAVVGGAAGLVVGLFAPPLLAATAIGAGIGAVVGKLKKKHEEKQLGVDLDEYLPPGSSAVVAIVDDVYADRVEAALVKSDKRINKAIDQGDYDELQKLLADPRPTRSRRLWTPNRPACRRGRHTRPALPATNKGHDDDIHSHAQPDRCHGFAGAARGGLWLERRQLGDNDDHQRVCNRDMGERCLHVDHDLAGRDQVSCQLFEERSDEERAPDGRRRYEVGDADALFRPERAGQARYPVRPAGERLARSARRRAWSRT